jgi:hypothetical protein
VIDFGLLYDYAMVAVWAGGVGFVLGGAMWKYIASGWHDLALAYREQAGDPPWVYGESETDGNTEP